MRVLFWLILALLVLFDFQYIGDGWTIHYQGEAVGVLAFTLGVVFLVNGIFNRTQDLLITQGKLRERVSTPYDIFPVLLLLPFFVGAQFSGEYLNILPTIADKAQMEPFRWAFQWGLSAKPIYATPLMFLGMLVLIFLYRVMRLLSALREHDERTRSTR